ncbi:MAG: FHA domain-containing protein [Bradymonadaceae bacterium]|nr:FHA domain-containing protein [Lujinxingiaceae bacterium]
MGLGEGKVSKPAVASSASPTAGLRIPRPLTLGANSLSEKLAAKKSAFSFKLPVTADAEAEADQGPSTDRLSGDDLDLMAFEDSEAASDEANLDELAAHMPNAHLDLISEVGYDDFPDEEQSGPHTANLSIDQLEFISEVSIVELDEDFPDEATQLGAGLFENPAKSSDPIALAASPSVELEDDFGGEKTQISEGLDRLAPAPEEHEADRTELASFDEVFARSGPEAGPEAGRTPVVADSRRLPVAPIQIEVDDDEVFTADKTELFDSPFENDPICPKLSVLDGPAAGQEFLVNKMRNTVGRGTNNTIVVADISMSRQHFEINKSLDETFIVRDLQAVNGTFLNGTRILEADLFHGDRIEAGKSVIQFLITSTSAPVSRNRRIIPAASPDAYTLKPGMHATLAGTHSTHSGSKPPDSSRVATFVAIGFAALCIPLAGMLIFLNPAEPAKIAAAPLVAQVTASQTYLEGVEAVKQRDWERAQDFFKQTAELEPAFDGVEAQLERIATELWAQQLLEEAEADVKANHSERALAKIGQISRNSVYYDDAQRLVRQVRQQEVFSTFEKARASVDQGNLEEGEKLADRLLEIAPQHEGALKLKERIEQTRAEQQRQQESAARALVAGAAAERAPRAAARTLQDDDIWSIAPARTDRQQGASRTNTGAAAPVINFTEGFALYRARKFSEATSHFDNIAKGSSGAIGQRAEKLATDIRRFERSFVAGQRAIANSGWAEAVRHLQEAKRADVAIGGETGYFEADLSEMLARSFGELGFEALNEKQYARAFTSLKRGNSEGRAEATLARLAAELDREAKSLNTQAAGLKQSDSAKAAALCRTVMTMVAPSSASYQQAKRLLDEL